MALVFQRLELFPSALGGSQLQWKLNPLFKAAAPYTFQVQASRSGVTDSEDWFDLGATQTGSGSETVWSLTDALQRHWSTADRFFYRVKLTDADDVVFVSEPVFFMGTLNRRDWVLVREILRKEELRLKYVGTCGQLHKRRYWGTRCPFPDCLDHSTREVTNGNCPVCFGTGWQGGYYVATQYTLETAEAAPHVAKIVDGMGLTSQMIIRARGIPCPMPRTNDMWIDGSDTRWFVDSVTSVASVRGFDTVLQIVLREAQPTDIAYHVSDQTISDALLYGED